jgi:uncharacterized membrane protein YgdD (TMEM256/DUF423 family)
MGDSSTQPRWVWLAGVGHALIGLILLFLTLHPLRDALDAHGLDLIQVMSAVQAGNGLGLMLLARREGGSRIAPALIAGGALASALMIWIIAFTGAHPFDPMVPLGGLAMIAGWVKLLFEKP